MQSVAYFCQLICMYVQLNLQQFCTIYTTIKPGDIIYSSLLTSSVNTSFICMCIKQQPLLYFLFIFCFKKKHYYSHRITYVLYIRVGTHLRHQRRGIQARVYNGTYNFNNNIDIQMDAVVTYTKLQYRPIWNEKKENVSCCLFAVYWYGVSLSVYWDRLPMQLFLHLTFSVRCVNIELMNGLLWPATASSSSNKYIKQGNHCHINNL